MNECIAMSLVAIGVILLGIGSINQSNRLNDMDARVIALEVYYRSID